MSKAREPNPLRPYYVPPSVSSGPNAFSSGDGASNRHASTSTSNLGSSARNILVDMDYSEYMSNSGPSPAEFVKNLIEQAAWKYTSVFLAQPFEVAKTVLQVHVARRSQNSIAKDPHADGTRRRPGIHKSNSYDVRRGREIPISSGETLPALILEQSPSDESDLDSPSYFTSSAPLAHTPSRPTRGRRRRASPSQDSIPRVHTPQSPPEKSQSPHTLDLKSSSSVLAALSSLWNTEGAWGVWKGTNSTYVYSILLSTITSFARSFFSAFFALPDPGLSFGATPSSFHAGGLDILSSPSPFSSLIVAISAVGIARAVLAPLDIARTKLILTPSTHPPRSIIATLRRLPSWSLPFSIAPATILHATLPTLMSASTPLFLRSKLGIDPILTPNTYAVATFLGQATELIVKLPIETVLRRGQMEVARSSTGGKDLQTVVEVGPYKGLFGTMRSIIYEEGEKYSPTALPKGTKGASGMKMGKTGQEKQRRKGQGLEGLWRGWRVGMWGLIGVWGAATLGVVGSKGGEF